MRFLDLNKLESNIIPAKVHYKGQKRQTEYTSNLHLIEQF